MFKGKIPAFIIMTLWLSFSHQANGQDVSNFSQFYFNPSLLNPSFTGIDGQAAAFLSYRRQWVGIEGAPAVSQFSFQAPNPKRIAIGLNTSQDKRGPVSTSSVLISTGYNIPLSKEVYMRFGMSFGAGFFRTDINSLKFSLIAADPVLTNLLQSDIQLLANAGISIHSRSFHVGLAVPHLFQSEYLATNSFTVGAFKPLDQLIIHGSYRYYLNNGQFLFEPYVNYRLNKTLPSQIEVAGVLHLKNLVWMGSSYKQDFGISGLMGFKFSQTMALGYAYSMKNTGINELASPSHEVQLGFLFGTRLRNIPAYSFVNSEKPRQRGRPSIKYAQIKKKKPALVVTKAKPVTSKASPPKEAPVIQRPSQQAAPIASNQQRPAIQPPVQAAPTNRPAATPQPQVESQAATRLRTPATDPSADNRDRPDNQQAGAPRLTQKPGGGLEPVEDDEGEDASMLHGTSHLADSLQEVDELDRLDRLEDHKDDPMEVHTGPAANAGRYERVKRGDHPKEIKLGEFVVVGTFRTEANAKKWVDGLQELGFLDVEYGYSSGDSSWFVHFPGANNLDEAKASNEKYRKTKIFRDAWVLTVEP